MLRAACVLFGIVGVAFGLVTLIGNSKFVTEGPDHVTHLVVTLVLLLGGLFLLVAGFRKNSGIDA